MRITLDGQTIEAVPGDTVAAALLRARITTFTRSIKYHRPRGPFCFSGTCGQCLMRVDGVPSLPACRVRAEEGMVCERQNAPLGLVESDLFRVADFLFPKGLDHHHLLVQSRLLGRVALEVARRLAGLGELPSAAGEARAQVALRKVPLVIVGAGRAGVSAARAAAEAGCGTLLVEREGRPGGAAHLQLDAGRDLAWVADQLRRFTAAGGELLLDADCVGLYSNDTGQPGNALLAVRRGSSLMAVLAERVVVANGCAAQPLPFPGVDRPGVYAARGLLGLGVRVGKTLAVVGEKDEAAACARGLERAGYQIARIAAPTSTLRALGSPVRALDVDGERVRCDAVAIAMPPAPLHELASSAGATARWDGSGFPLETDAGGCTAVPWLFAAGSVAGKPSEQSGEAAGRAACR